MIRSYRTLFRELRIPMNFCIPSPGCVCMLTCVRMRCDARRCAYTRPAPLSARAHVCAYPYALHFVCLCDALIGRMAAIRCIRVRSGRLKATQSTPPRRGRGCYETAFPDGGLPGLPSIGATRHLGPRSGDLPRVPRSQWLPCRLALLRARTFFRQRRLGLQIS